MYFGSWFLVYQTGINGLAIQSEDTLPSMFLPVTIIKEKTLYADTYYQMLIAKYPSHDDRDYKKGYVPFYFRQVGQHYITAFPIMAGLIALPIYFIPLSLQIPVTWENLTMLSHVTAALIVSLSGGFLYLLLKRNFTDKKKSLLLTAVFLFATVNFAMISQSLWQHGVLQLFTTLSLLFLYEYKKLAQESILKKKWIPLFLSGLFFGLGVLSRPTAALFFPFLLMLLIEKDFKAGDVVNLLKRCFVYTMGLIPSLLFFLWYNATFYRDIANQGYSNQLMSNWLGRFPEGFLGLWLSPSKGILVYSPVFVFIFVSLYLLYRTKALEKKKDMISYALLCLIYTLIMGKWKHWYGGWSFGYRMASDILPFLTLLLVPFLNSSLFSKKSLRVIFFLLFFTSIAIQLMGIAFFDGYWHGTYDLGFKNTSWLWSINNSEVMFNLRRFIDKIS